MSPMDGPDDGGWTSAFVPARHAGEHHAPPAAVVITVDDTTQIGAARRAAAAVATRLGFAEVDVSRVALVATEAATNLARYATGGILLIQAAAPPCAPARRDGLGRDGLRPDGAGEDGVSDEGLGGQGFGIELVAVDRGPGIRDLARASVDGFSSGGTAGEGLGAMRRASDQFDLYSVPARLPDPFAVARTTDGGLRPGGMRGAGTVVLARLWAGQARTAPRVSRRREATLVGGVSVPLAGEPVCGDAWAACATPSGCRVLVVDGLGHGYAAFEAAQLAVRLFRDDMARDTATGTPTPLTDLIAHLHAGLRSTRGAAVAIADVHTIDRADVEDGKSVGEVRFAGVGNIAASVSTPDGESRSLVSHNGTVGHQLRKVQEFRASWPPHGALVLHTDGIRTQWSLGDSPGLAQRDPTVVAAALWRDHARGRDDATVVVVRDAVASERDEHPSPA